MNKTIPPRWPAQEEALKFALLHPACMLNMEMGTGKTRVAIDLIMERNVKTVLVVCPKAVMNVWPKELQKYAKDDTYKIFQRNQGESVNKTAERLWDFMEEYSDFKPKIVIINYDSIWRKPLGDYLIKLSDKGILNMVILDESHRAKAARSKVSKYLAMLGRRVRFKMCLTGTPMANSPLDIYGQYRFLNHAIFGTNYEKFKQQYAILGGPERNFVVGFKNQQDLMEKFNLIAYTCHMSDIADKIKLPESLPPVSIDVQLPNKDMKTLHKLEKEFIAECEGGFVSANNVLVKILRMQQICSGFCLVQDSPLDNAETREINTAKAEALNSIMMDLPPKEPLVVFCLFIHDLDTVSEVTEAQGRPYYELSGRRHDIDGWNGTKGAVVAVQIQAGAEGIDMTWAHHAIYFSLPHSLALYEQSRARLYRPGQNKQTSFIHLIAANTIDEVIYNSLQNKKNIIESIRKGTFDFGYLKK